LVSVVIPALNEERYLRRCLEAVWSQDYTAEWLEVLVVDGRSTDRTREIAIAAARVHPNLRLLDNPAGTIPCGLNTGIRVARGSVIVRVDGHAVIAPDYISQCVRALGASGADNVGGPMRSRGIGFWGQAIGRAMRSPFAGPAKFHHATEPQEVDTVYLGAFRREALERVGLYDESLLRNEDYELNYRIRRAGGRIYYTPDIRVDYFGRESLTEVIRQYWNYGRSKAVVLRRHPGSLQPRHLAASTFVLALTGGIGLATLGRPRPLLALLGVYSATAAYFSLRAARGGGPRLTVALALIFSCMHLCYGVGLLLELFRPDRRMPANRGPVAPGVETSR
jgi:succinoglycan biosynthesis protein ExoA